MINLLFKRLLPRVLNLLLWLCFCLMTGTGLLLQYRLPPGSRGGSGMNVAGMSRHEWGDLHSWIGLVFIVLIVVHMALHWRWFWQVASRKRSIPILAGILAGLALIVLLIAWPVTRKERGEGRRSESRSPSSTHLETPTHP